MKTGTAHVKITGDASRFARALDAQAAELRERITRAYAADTPTRPRFSPGAPSGNRA